MAVGFFGKQMLKTLIKGGKQKTTGTEVVNPFKFKPSKSKLEKTVRKLEVESKKSHNRILGDIEKIFDNKGLQKARTNLRQTTQKLGDLKVTKSGFNKGKDLKK